MQGAAVKAAANMGPTQRRSMVLTAFNPGSPMHLSLIKAGSTCLGRAQAWVLIAADDTEADTSLVDNLIALQSMRPPQLYSPLHK